MFSAAADGFPKTFFNGGETKLEEQGRETGVKEDEKERDGLRMRKIAYITRNAATKNAARPDWHLAHSTCDWTFRVVRGHNELGEIWA